MLFVLSPAKRLDFSDHPNAALATAPRMATETASLARTARRLTGPDLKRMMGISDDLAKLNRDRFRAFDLEAETGTPAVLAFAGDVYQGLQARTLDQAALDWGQGHLRILSGLYGVLRPLDWMQPYRLEMGTKLATGKGKNLYQFWGVQIADYLNQRAAADISPVIVNLASEEYFKAVDRKALKARVVTCVFEEFRGDQYKIISFMAKRARVLMVRYAVENQLTTVDKLKEFAVEGYGFEASASTLDRLVFRRGQYA